MTAWFNCLGVEPSILRGDTGLMGWGITLAYGVTVVVLCLCWVRAPRSERRFWCVLVFALGFLALNKQLDLQVLLNAYGRCVAKSQGWFDARRAVQAAFVAVFLLVLLMLLGRGLWVIWPKRRQMAGLIAGIFVLCLFVAARAMSIQHVDAAVGISVDLSRIKNLLELTGVCLIAANGLILLRNARSKIDKRA